ncbi:unnamed protein product [Lactuca virosa]|uniref:Protein kinase domain-containing protein n=1 Tax=Lactuca virosa TaxID=75947 RepID=A0AAU9PSG9_9ASTR|nr:unnamed protein product [Lactuca virosa]
MGVLSDGSKIAVKQLSARLKQGNREFVTEIGMISALQHPNLVKLYGCCIEGKELLLVYEYLINNSLARALFGREDQKLNLDEESRLKIVHRDIKATNVLFDKDLNAKISNFGLAKLDEEENTHISTRIAGTIGYMAPEYAMRGYLTDKADVYNFGVVALEIVNGKSNTNYRPKEEFLFLLDWNDKMETVGSETEAYAIADIMAYCKSEVYTVNCGMAFGTKYDLDYKSPNRSGQNFKSGEDMVEMLKKQWKDSYGIGGRIQSQLNSKFSTFLCISSIRRQTYF